MADAILQVEHVTKTFSAGRGLRRGGTVYAVDDVSLAIHPGETLGLVGESGSGKTTLARLILGLLKPDSGSVLLDGKPLSASRRQNEIGAVFQDPASSLNPHATVYRSLERPLQLHGIDKASARDMIYETAAHVNLGRELLERFPHELSGGQQQRVSIARAIMLRPKLLVLDEPTSALDVSVQAQTLNELLDLQEQYGLAYLFISHNLSVVRYMSDRICVLYGGKVMEMGEAEAVYDRYVHPYTLSLLSSVPPLHPSQRDRKKLLLNAEAPLSAGTGCRFAPRCPFADEDCRNKVPELQCIGEDHFSACEKHPDLAAYKADQ